MQSNETQELTGNITFIKNDYGFISTHADAPKGYESMQFFFHFSNVQRGVRPVLGLPVSFLLGQPLRVGQKMQAIRVRPFVSVLDQGALSVLGGSR